MLVSILGYFVALFRMEMVSQALEPSKEVRNREARGGAGEARGRRGEAREKATLFRTSLGYFSEMGN